MEGVFVLGDVMPTPDDDLLVGLLTHEEVAKQLGVAPRTLSRWHQARLGPPRVKMGKTVLYRVDAVREWLKSLEQDPVRWRNGDVARIKPQRRR